MIFMQFIDTKLGAERWKRRSEEVFYSA